MPVKTNQFHLSTKQNQAEFHRVLTTSPLPSNAQALDISMQSPTGPNQIEAHSEEFDAPTGPKASPPGAQALLDVLSTPDMRDMDELVVTLVAANWQTLALRLGVGTGVSKVILDTHPNNCVGACRDMLHRWLRGEQHTGEEERTWSTFLTALGRAGFVELERSLWREHFRKV